MNQTIVKNWNSVVDHEDTVYLLGDVMLGDRERGLYYLKQFVNTCKEIFISNYWPPENSKLEVTSRFTSRTKLALEYL